MPSCAVKWCRSHTDMKNTGIAFHLFPKNKILRRKWVAAVRLERNESDWTPSRSSRICSIHFRHDEISKPNNGRHTRLRKSAVPICTMVASSTAHTTAKEKYIIVQLRRAHQNYGDKDTSGQNSIIKKKCDTATVIIANVYHYLQAEYDNLKSFISSSYVLSPLGNILKRTAEATGVSEQTVTSILEERKLCEDPEPEIVGTEEAIIKFDDDEMRPVTEETSCGNVTEDQHGDSEMEEEAEIGRLKLEFDEDGYQIDAVRKRSMLDIGPTLGQIPSPIQLRVHRVMETEYKTEPAGDECPPTLGDDSLETASSLAVLIKPEPLLNPVKTEPWTEDQNMERNPVERHTSHQLDASPLMKTSVYTDIIKND